MSTGEYNTPLLEDAKDATAAAVRSDSASREIVEDSYGQIVSSSSIIGGAQAVNMMLSLVRTKMAAILVGPQGVGLLAIYQSIIQLATTVSSLGIQASGVREVALRETAGDPEGVARTVRTVQRICWVTGTTGMFIVILLAPSISNLTFGNAEYTIPLSALAFSILLANLNAGQSAILQGKRRLADLAKISIISAAAGTFLAVGLYWWLGIEGIVPLLVLLPAISLGLSVFFARRVSLADAVPAWRETWQHSKSLVLVGMGTVVGGVLATGVAYVSNLMIKGEHGLDGAGICSAAFALSAMFVQFVLGAMSTDYFPRLSGHAGDHQRMIKLINEQTEVGLLLSFPGMVATCAFAPYVIKAVYSPEFAAAGELLRWFVLGCLGRVISWPLGFCLMAKGNVRLNVLSEVGFNALHLVLIWAGLRLFGLMGVAIAFAGAYFAHVAGMRIATGCTVGFRWSARVLSLLCWMVPFSVAMVGVSSQVSAGMMLWAGGILSFVTGIICLRLLVTRLEPAHRLVRLLRNSPLACLLPRAKDPEKPTAGD